MKIKGQFMYDTMYVLLGISQPFYPPRPLFLGNHGNIFASDDMEILSASISIGKDNEPVLGGPFS